MPKSLFAEPSKRAVLNRGQTIAGESAPPEAEGALLEAAAPSEAEGALLEAAAPPEAEGALLLAHCFGAATSPGTFCSGACE